MDVEHLFNRHWPSHYRTTASSHFNLHLKVWITDPINTFICPGQQLQSCKNGGHFFFPKALNMAVVLHFTEYPKSISVVLKKNSAIQKEWKLKDYRQTSPKAKASTLSHFRGELWYKLMTFTQLRMLPITAQIRSFAFIEIRCRFRYASHLDNKGVWSSRKASYLGGRFSLVAC